MTNDHAYPVQSNRFLEIEKTAHSFRAHDISLNHGYLDSGLIWFSLILLRFWHEINLKYVLTIISPAHIVSA